MNAETSLMPHGEVRVTLPEVFTLEISKERGFTVGAGLRTREQLDLLVDALRAYRGFIPEGGL